MSVIFKGGTSGNRKDALPPVPDSGEAQPVLNTANDQSGSVVVWGDYPARPQRHGQHLSAEFMPEGGSFPKTSEDVCQQDVEKQYGGIPGLGSSDDGY